MDDSDGLVLAPGVASQIQAVVTSLLEFSPTVAVHTGWMGEVREIVAVDFTAFTDLLHGGMLAEGVSYQVSQDQLALGHQS